MLIASWDAVLIAISCLVAFIASFIALDTAGKVALSDGKAALMWKLAGGIALGIGIWSMHFIGMLAMSMPMMMSYSLWYTLLSLIVALFASTLSLHIGVSGTALGRGRLLMATLILSTGVVAMHYIGMLALMIAEGIVWNYWLIAASVVIAMVASCAALWLAFHLRHGEKGVLLMRLLAALVMGGAIAAMHYTGMAAATFMAVDHYHHGAINQQGLSIWVSVITLVILGVMLIISMLDAQIRSARLTERLREANNQLEHLALYDNLTGLPNRAHFQRLLERRLNQGEHGGSFAIMYMDLDGFKLVNDIWGHHTGDNLLLWVTQRMTGKLEGGTVLSRLGGDEFVLLMPDADEDRARQLAATLVDTVSSPFAKEDHPLIHVSLSVGIALYPQHGATPYALMLNADAAMYCTKQNGRNGLTFWDPQMKTLSQQQPALLREISLALRQGQFQLYYQPRINAANNAVQGYEALLRWHNPERGMLLPDDFLPVAEKSGLIIAIGEWVLQEACRQLQKWHQQGYPWLTMSVNISAVQFSQPGLIALVQNTLEHYHIPSPMLTLEITETVAMGNINETTRILTALTKIGVKVSIDDFGTGYSSLLYLRQLPASELKIDKAFVKELLSNNKNTRVVSAIIDVARSLNLDVVAEGVETEEQCTILSELGCTSMQGFWLGTPESAENASAVLSRQAGRHDNEPSLPGS